jgi:hypothetical protein
MARKHKPRKRKPRTTLERFLKSAQEIHGDKYSYEFVVFLGVRYKVKIKCPIHGIFEQAPEAHIRSQAGCPACAGRLTRALFIAKATAKHNGKYGYKFVKYTNCFEKVDIECFKHGIFSQTATIHLEGNGCPKCARELGRMTVSEFLARVKEVHGGRYGYEFVANVFETTQSLLPIKCAHHGMFEQVAESHFNGGGCPRCRTFVSKPETQWLDRLHIASEYRQSYLKVNGKRMSVDAYDPITNTVYEFYGDYWHGNPNVFASDVFNKRCGKTMQQLHDRTLSREALIKSAGYTLVSIWEADWKAQQKQAAALSKTPPKRVSSAARNAGRSCSKHR